MNVPFVDLQRQYHEIQAEMNQAALNVLESGRYMLGGEVDDGLASAGESGIAAALLWSIAAGSDQVLNRLQQELPFGLFHGAPRPTLNSSCAHLSP